MAPPLEFLCLTCGDDFNEVFDVKVPMTERVTALTAMIKEKSKLASVRLYKVSIPIDTNLKERIASWAWKQNPLLPHRKLSELFPALREGHLHILVEPCTGTSTQEQPPLISTNTELLRSMSFRPREEVKESKRQAEPNPTRGGDAPPKSNHTDNTSAQTQGARQIGGEARHLVSKRQRFAADSEAEDVQAPPPDIPPGRQLKRRRGADAPDPGRACDTCKNQVCEWLPDRAKCAKCVRDRKACLFDGANSRLLEPVAPTSANAGGSAKTGKQGTAARMSEAKASMVETRDGFERRGQLGQCNRGARAGGRLGADRLSMRVGGQAGRGEAEVIEIGSDVEMVGEDHVAVALSLYKRTSQPASRRIGPTPQRIGQVEGAAVTGPSGATRNVKATSNGGGPAHGAQRGRVDRGPGARLPPLMSSHWCPNCGTTACNLSWM